MTEQMRHEWSMPSGVVNSINRRCRRLIAFLASDVARHLTGQVMPNLVDIAMIHARGGTGDLFCSHPLIEGTQ